MKNQCHVFKEKIPRESRAFKVWTFEFTDEELKSNWDKMIERKEILTKAISDGIPIHRDVVLEQLPFNSKGWSKDYWMCRQRENGKWWCDYEECYLRKEIVR